VVHSSVNVVRFAMSTEARIPSNKKKCLRRLIYVCIAVVVVLVGLSIAVKLLVPSERIRQLIINELEKRTDREFTIGEVSVGLWRGLQVAGLSVREDPSYGEHDFIRASLLDVNVSLLPLLSKQIDARVKLIEPQIKIIRANNGKLNFQELMAAASGIPAQAETISEDSDPANKEESAAADWQYSVDVRVKKGLLLLEDRVSGRVAKISDCDLSIDDLTPDPMGLERPIEIKLSALGEGNGVAGKIKGDIGVKAKRGSSFQVRGELRLKDGVIGDERNPLPGGTLTWGLLVDMAKGSAALERLEFSTEGVKLQCTGTLSPEVELDITSFIEISELAGSLDKVMKSYRLPEMAGSATGKSSVRMVGSSIDVSGEMSLQNLSIIDSTSKERIELGKSSELNYSLSIGADEFQVKSLLLRSDLGGFSATGDGKVAGISSDKPTVEAHLGCKADLQEALNTLNDFIGFPPEYEARGMMDLSVDANGTLSELSFEGKGGLSDLLIEGLLPKGNTFQRERMDIAFVGSVSDGFISVPSISIEDPLLSARLKWDGLDSVTGEVANVDGAFTLGVNEVLTLLGDMIPSDLRVAGKLPGTISLDFAKKPIGFDLAFDATNTVMAYSNVFVKPSGKVLQLTAVGSPTTDGLDIDDIEILLGASRFRGKVSFKENYSTLAGELHSEELDIGSLTQFLPKLSDQKLDGAGSLKLEFSSRLDAENITKNTTATFGLSTGKVRVIDYALTSSEVSGKLDKGVLATDKIAVSGYGGKISGKAKVDFNPAAPAFEVAVLGENVGVDGNLPLLHFAMPILGGSLASIKGALDFEANLTGEGFDGENFKKKLKGSGSIDSDTEVRITNPWLIGPLSKYSDYLFKSISGEFEIGEGRVANEELILESTELDVIVSGWTSFDGPIDYSMTLKDKGNAFGSDLQKVTEYLSKDGSITVEIDGRISSPRPKIISSSLLQDAIQGLLEKQFRRDGEEETEESMKVEDDSDSVSEDELPTESEETATPSRRDRRRDKLREIFKRR